MTITDRIIAAAVRSRGMVLASVALLAAGGLWALSTLRVEALPDLTDVQVPVLVEAPGLSPVEVERLVAFPIEVAIRGLPDIKQIRSVSKYAFAGITVVFEDGVDIYFARALVNERLQSVRAVLPPQAEASLGPLAGAISEIYLYTVQGRGHDLMELRTVHDRIVRPRLAAVAGVAEINAFGGFVRQVKVTIDPDRLVAYGLTLHDVVEAVQAGNAVAAGGYLEHQDEQYILRGLGQVSSLEDVERTVIAATPAGAPVMIRDVASVGFGSEIRQGAVSRDGRGEVMSGIVMMRRGENSRDVVRRVAERVPGINRALPAGIQVVPYYDQTQLVAGTLGTLRTNLIEGGLLVVAILLLFLGNVRAALIVAATIPLSLLAAFLGMRWLGLSANLMSLGAIDFGLIVDGSVVMTEHYVKHLHADEERGAFPQGRQALAARLTLLGQEVARPILFGVLIILLVYLPILTLEGLEGRMFRPMAMTVAMALFGSLLLALAFIPAVATMVFRRGAPESKLALRMATRLDTWYAAVLSRVMRRPLATTAVAVGALALTLLLLAPRLGTEFLPELDEGSITIQAIRDPSVSLTRSIAMQRDIERILGQFPEVVTVVSRVGRAEIGSDPMGINMADVFVMLERRSEWRSGLRKEDLVKEMEDSLLARVPGVAYSFTQPMAMRLDELIIGVRADLAVKVFGDDPQRNMVVAAEVGEVLGRIAGAAEVQVQATEGQSYLNVRLDRTALARFGIRMTDVQEALETAVGGRPVTSMVEGSYAVDVVVQYPQRLRNSVEAIGAITIPAPSGARVPLSQLAAIRLESGPVQVNRESAQRVVVVQANVRGRDLGSFVEDARRAVAERVDVPAGMFVEFGGEFENQQRAMQRLRVVVPLSIATIAALLYVSLGSWLPAGLVLVNLPFAAVGGVVALWLRGLHLSVSASIGFIALFGVAVLNGLVLLTTVQRERQGGTPPREAAMNGARARLRPVLMTALVASIGFLPVAISHGTGAEVQRPLATVVIGGLVSSTLLTLLVIPTLYARIEEYRAQRRAVRRDQP